MSIPQYGIPIIDKVEKFVWTIVYWLARFAVLPLKFLKITPNQVTFWSAVINFGLAAYCFAQGTYLWNLGGLFFLLLHTYFDLVDGSLARETGQTSKLGRWLDLIFDYLGTAIVMIGIGYGLYRKTASSFWLIIVILIMFAKFALAVAHFYYGNSIYQRMDFRRKFKKDTKMTGLDWLVENFVIPDSTLFFFFYNIRYFLFLTILLNKLDWFLVITAFLYNLRWIILFWVYGLALGDKPKLRIIRLLAKYIDASIFEEK